VLKYTKWNPYHNKGNGELFSHESCMEKNKLQYFTFSNSKKPIKAVIRHLPPPHMPAVVIYNSLYGLGCNGIKVRQTTATQTAPNGQTYIEPLPLFLVILTRNIKPQEIFKLNSLNHIIIKVDLYRALKLALRNDTTAKTLAMSALNASNALNVCGAVVATCTGNALKRQIQDLRRAAAIAS
jgi:hypothetical protein